MTNIKIRNLNEAKNKWVIGTLPAVKEPSFQSKVLQIKYNYKPDKTKFKEETYHKHSTPIEECYLCINGALHIEIEGKKFLLKSNEILNVPPNQCHKIIDFSDDVIFFVIRSPISDNSTKITC